MTDEHDGAEPQNTSEGAGTPPARPAAGYLARNATAVIIGVLAVSLAAVTAVAVALWVQNSREIADVPHPRPTVKLGVPVANPETSTTTTTTTTTTSSSRPGTATTSISVPGPTTSSAPRPATPDEEYELTNVLKAFYAALGAKNLDVLNALSCVKLTAEDLADQPDDLVVTVDKVEQPLVDGDTASAHVSITAAAGGKSVKKSGTAGFARISSRWVTCANQ